MSNRIKGYILIAPLVLIFIGVGIVFVTTYPGVTFAIVVALTVLRMYFKGLDYLIRPRNK